MTTPQTIINTPTIFFHFIKQELPFDKIAKETFLLFLNFPNGDGSFKPHLKQIGIARSLLCVVFQLSYLQWEKSFLKN